MTTSAVSNQLQNDTSAHFQAWYNAVTLALFTTLGVTQTSDTGQIGATASVPAANTSAGYVIGRFNDTLQSTTPIFFKLEFGTGSSGIPQMWLTVGTSSNGSGTIGSGGGGAVSTRVACMNGSGAVASSGALTFRFCYLGTTQAGILWCGIGYNGVILGTTPGAYGGFCIMRTSDSSGNASSAGIVCMVTQSSATNPGNAAANGYQQNISIANSALIPTTPINSWESIPATGNQFILGLTATLVGSTAFVAPIYTCDPLIKYSAYFATGMLTDFAFANTSSFAIVGGTPMTFIAAGCIFGSAIGFNGNGSAATRTIILPWQ